jgi:hypothetical protein
VPSKYVARFAYGHVVVDDRHLIVSRVLGTSIVGLGSAFRRKIVQVALGAESAVKK